MEPLVYFQRGEGYPYPKHLVKSSYLLNVALYHLKFGLQEVGKIKRVFLWGGGNLDHKPHLVKWATMCLDRKFDGLDVRELHKLN